MDLSTVMKGGQLAGRRKLVIGVVGLVAVMADYLTGAIGLADAVQQAAQQLVPTLLGL